MRRVAIYGKGGIGKSTTTSNVSAALADEGYKVMQIGCDPKADSTKLLTHNAKKPSILETIRDGTSIEDAISEGYNGIICAECGGPRPGSGCAGRGIIAAFEEMERTGIVERYKPDIMIYDVLGDVVCGGFAMPIRNGYAHDVFVVTSGEMMSLFAANNIFQAVSDFSADGYARFSGLIQNSRNVDDEDGLVNKAAKEMGCGVVHRIPRDPVVQKCESLGTTVIEGISDSDLAESYRKLAKIILDSSEDKAGGMRAD
jgi:Nitrogenase subunit NifH (ATPase)